jgi:uncharacterized protein (TIGR00255 family)
MEKRIRSMTGFGKAYYRDDKLKLIVLIRSVNGKGLEINFRLPKELSIYEKELRTIIKDKVYRGNISVSVSLDLYKVKPAVKISDLTDIVDEIIASTKRLGLSISDDYILQLAFKFYNPLQSEDTYFESEEFKEVFFGVFNKALEDFLKSKYEEGQNLLKDIETQLKTLKELLKKVEQKRGELTKKAKERLLTRAKELLGDFCQDVTKNSLVSQELKLLLEKIDINEEIKRLKSHIQLFEEELKKGAPIGKKLEFITQEMLREVNTAGNKLPDLFPLNVEMKTAIDKLKQQVVNIE